MSRNDIKDRLPESSDSLFNERKRLLNDNARLRYEDERLREEVKQLQAEIERLQAENNRLHEGLPPEFVPIQDNNNASDKDSEIERLKGEVKHLGSLLTDSIAQKVEQLICNQQVNKRLRELLEKALIYSHSMPTTLVAAIEKEVSDE